MHALPFAIALALAALIAPALLRAMCDGGHVRRNYRDRLLPFLFGVLTLAVAPLALAPLALLARLASVRVFEPELVAVSVYALGVIALGLLDDLLGDVAAARIDAAGLDGGGHDTTRGETTAAPRGWRGHSAAALRGKLSTGALKAGGSLGLALLATSTLALSNGRWLLGAGVLVLATHAFNLLDLRPARSPGCGSC